MLREKVFTKVLCGSLAVLFSLSLVACGSKTKTEATETKAAEQSLTAVAEAKSDPVKLKFLHIFPEAQKEVDESIKVFNSKYPNVTVEQTVVPWDKCNETLQIAFASGDAPDVSFWWTHAMGQWVTIGAALDLTPYFEKDKAWKESFLSESMLDMGKVNGKYYNVPFRGTTTYLVYNKDMFDKNGWAYPTATIEDMEKTMDKILAAGITPFALAGKPNGYQINSIYWYFRDFEFLKAGLYNDEAFLNERKTDIEGPYAAALTKIRTWYKKGYFGKDALGISREEAQAAFMNQKGVMSFINNNELAAIRKLNDGKFKMGFTPFPHPAGTDEYMLVGGFDGWIGYSKTQHPEETVAFLKALSSVEVANIWAKGQLNAMTTKGVTYEDPDLKVMAENLGWVGKYATHRDYNNGDRSTQDEQNFVNFLTNDSMTPVQAEQKYNDILKKVLEDAGVK